MRRSLLLGLLFTVLLASAPTADAQLGRLLNRARQAVTNTSSTPAADAASPATLDGRPAPALDYTRFLNARYWPLQGKFEFSSPNHHLIFPPANLEHYDADNGEYLIRATDGTVVARHTLGTIATTRSDAFVTLGTRGEADWDGPLGTGSYTLDLVFQGNIASRIPFSIEATDGGDPFDPKTIYRRSGPWSELAYFEHDTDRTDYQLTFNAWVSSTELGAENGRVRFTLTRNGEPIAASKESLDPFVNTGGDWGVASTYLVTHATRTNTNPTFFTIADMTPGSYVMSITHLENGSTIREYAFEGGNGTFVPHVRSAMNHEPRYEYLTPRRMGGQSLNQPYSVYWVDAR